MLSLLDLFLNYLRYNFFNQTKFKKNLKYDIFLEMISVI